MNFHDLLRKVATMTLDEFNSQIEKLPTQIWGLKYLPTARSFMSDEDEIPRVYESETGYHIMNVTSEVSDCNRGVMWDILKSFDYNMNAIMEIGVNRNDVKSLSQILIHGKPDSCKYLGVDLDDKSFLNNHEKNVFTLQSNSHDQTRVRNYLKEIGIDKLDILFIDGWHSITTTVNDWEYADLLSEKGVVVIHDTNYHPGDVAIIDAIDENLFDVKKYCLDNDFGIAVARRK